MIASKDYLKDYRTMNEKEKKDYLDRVVKWTDETFPELLAIADCWEKVPVKDFDEGCRLASAIVNARPLVSNIARYEADRAVKKINAYLTKVREKSGLAKLKTRPASDTRRFRAVVPEKGTPSEDGSLKRKEYEEQEVDGRRPKEFVLYKERLPKELREKGEKELGDMYLALAEYRGTLEAMVENPNVTQEARQDMAEKSLAAEQKIRAFWAEVDGYLKSADQPEAVQAEEDESAYIPMMKRPGDYTMEEINAMEDPRMQDVCRKARIEFDKKYIRRDDVKITDKYREQLELRVRELIAWGEELPKKTVEKLNAAEVRIPGVNAPYGEKETGAEDEKPATEAEGGKDADD